MISKLDFSRTNDQFKNRLSLMRERIIKKIPLIKIDFEKLNFDD